MTLRRGIPVIAKSGAWALTSQVANSGSNYIVLILLARSMDLAQYGRFSIIFLLATLLNVFVRATASQVILLQRGERGDPSGFLRAARLAAVVTSSVTLLTALVLLDEVWVSGLIAVGSYFLVAQDSRRYVCIARSQWKRVATSDISWLLVVLAYVVCASPSPAGVVSSWTLGGLCAYLILHLRLSNDESASSWLRRNRGDLSPLSGEAGLQLLVGYSLNWLIVFVSGYDGVGLFRAAQLCMTPIGTVGQAVTALLLRRDAGDATELRARNSLQFVFTLCFLNLLVIAWTALLIIPLTGRLFLGKNWTTVDRYLLLLAVGELFVVTTLTILVWAKGRYGPKSIFKFRLRLSWSDPLFIGLGSIVLPGVGSIIGLMVSQIATALAAFAAYPGFRSVFYRKPLRGY